MDLHKMGISMNIVNYKIISMELYLHIGYHKTGSSFLQSLFATNRDWFESQGIYYPKGYRDKEAQSGLISPGNGIEFLTAMNNGDFEKAKLMVGQWKREADNRGCNRILISSEGLFHSFANIGFEKIEHVLNSIGFNKIFGLLYVRDPLDHAISLFKHRSKSGSILDFKQWVERKYETIMLSKVFFQSLHLSKIKWTIRRYNKDKEFMIYSCFIEWLKISKPK